MNIAVYDASGLITGRLSLARSEDAKLYANYIEISAAQMTMPIEITHRVNPVSRIIEEKIPITVTIDKPQIAADGLDEAAVTFLGLTGPVTARVGNQRVLVTPLDNVIRITSNAVVDLPVSIENDPVHFLSGGAIVRAK